jgi:hypothetical protein
MKVSERTQCQDQLSNFLKKIQQQHQAGMSFKRNFNTNTRLVCSKVDRRPTLGDRAEEGVAIMGQI